MDRSNRVTAKSAARCDCGKLGYYDRKTAKRAAAQMAMQDGRTRRLFPYQCRRSAWWHLTSATANSRGWLRTHMPAGNE